MSDDDIIELADKAKLPFWNNSGVPIHMNELRKFAELVIKHMKDKGEQDE